MIDFEGHRVEKDIMVTSNSLTLIRMLSRDEQPKNGSHRGAKSAKEGR